MQNQDVVNNLILFVRNYDGLNKEITSVKNRSQQLNPDLIDDYVKGLDSLKGKLARRMGKELFFFDIWNKWLCGVPGIGPAIGGHLILLYYFRRVPVCRDCGTDVEKKKIEDKNEFFCHKCDKSIKGEGNLLHRVEEKDFPTISKWWAYMGRGIVDGNIPKRKKGVVVNWSTKGRTVGFFIGESFIKQGNGHEYKRFYDERKKRHEAKHPEATKMHRHNMAKNEAIKLFLSHFWQLARTMDGKPLTTPYSEGILGHEHIIPPYYFPLKDDSDHVDLENGVE